MPRSFCQAHGAHETSSAVGPTSTRLAPSCSARRTVSGGSHTALQFQTRRRTRPARSRWSEVARAALHYAREVSLTVEKANRNTRRIYAAVEVAAPIEQIWLALTDYEGLANFIPGLTENKCLEKRPQGAQLLQVGEQSIALGAKFRATVVLDIQEYASGVPQRLCFKTDIGGTVASAGQRLFPEPRTRGNKNQPQDIAFSMVEGDFAAFRGIWRMQENGPNQSLLSYSLHVQPQPWLPVNLIQGRIEGEVKTNLRAVRDYSEKQWKSKS